MWPHRNKNSRWLTAACLALFGTCASAQTNATLHLKSGAVLSGEVRTIGPASLSISLTGTSGSLTQNYADITRIEWPEPDLWREAMAALDRGAAQEALELFTKLSTAPADVSFHPAPGNFALRARRMMLQCHRRLRDGAAIAKLVRQIDWAGLPEQERTVSPLLKVWSLVGASDWPAAKVAAEEAARSINGAHSDFAELSFLLARIASKLGNTDEAIATYAVCYTLPSSDPGLSGDAIRESAALFVALPERKNELRALAHLYATTIGRGNLWKDAPAEAVKLLGEELHKPIVPAAPEAKEDMTTPAAGPWVSVAKLRFEPPAPGTPAPAPDPSKKPLKFEARGGAFKSIEAPAGWTSAETRVGQFSTDKSHGTLVRGLKEDPLLQLAKGKSLRLAMELRLGKLETNASKDEERVSFLRFGLLDAKKAGYGVNISLMADAKGLSIMADPGGDEELLGGPGVMKLPAEGSPSPDSITGGTVLPCEITLRVQEDGKVRITARVDKVTGAATVDPAAGQPVISNFSGGFFLLRIGKPKTSALFDNVSIEVSP